MGVTGVRIAAMYTICAASFTDGVYERQTTRVSELWLHQWREKGFPLVCFVVVYFV